MGAERAIRELLIEKGVLTAEEISAQVDLMTAARQLGAKWLPGPGRPGILGAAAADTFCVVVERHRHAGRVPHRREHPKVHTPSHAVLLLSEDAAWASRRPGTKPRVSFADGGRPRGVLREFGLELPDMELRTIQPSAPFRFAATARDRKAGRGSSLRSPRLYDGTAVEVGRTRPAA